MRNAQGDAGSGRQPGARLPRPAEPAAALHITRVTRAILSTALRCMAAGVPAALAASPVQAAPAGSSASPAYASAESAFLATFVDSGLGQRAYRENREYAAALYRLPDGSWHATPVLAGTRTASTIPYHLVPPGAVQIAGAHTHGQPHIPEDPTRLYGLNFSKTDLQNALHNFRITRGVIAVQYLLSADRKILRLSLSADPRTLGDAGAHAPGPDAVGEMAASASASADATPPTLPGAELPSVAEPPAEPSAETVAPSHDLIRVRWETIGAFPEEPTDATPAGNATPR